MDSAKMVEEDVYIKKFLINEYNQLFSEVRYINDKIHSYSKIIFTIISSFIIYTLAGSSIILIQKDIPTICLLFGLLGLFLVIFVFYIVYIGLRQFSASKMHKVRYWRAIHAIRGLLIKLYPSFKENIILPTGREKSTKEAPRPNVSPGEFFTGFFITFGNYIFFSIFFVYFWTLFEISLKLVCGKINICLSNFILDAVIQQNIITAIISSLVFLSVISALYPHNSLWYYYKNLQTARIISATNPYFSFNIDYSKSVTGKLIKGVTIFLVILLIFFRTGLFLGLLKASLILLLFSVFSVLLILLLQTVAFTVRREILLSKHETDFPFLRNDIVSDVNLFFHHNGVSPKSRTNTLK